MLPPRRKETAPSPEVEHQGDGSHAEEEHRKGPEDEATCAQGVQLHGLEGTAGQETVGQPDKEWSLTPQGQGASLPKGERDGHLPWIPHTFPCERSDHPLDFPYDPYRGNPYGCF